MGAAVTLRRRVEWIDTDAAGIYHWTTVFRWVEAAEAELHDRLGIRSTTFGRTPRVHVDADFRRQLVFHEAVAVRLEVASIGRSSLRYAFRVTGEDGATAAEGTLVVVFVTSQPDGGPTPWPDELRGALLDGGDQGEA